MLVSGAMNPIKLSVVSIDEVCVPVEDLEDAYKQLVVESSGLYCRLFERQVAYYQLERQLVEVELKSRAAQGSANESASRNKELIEEKLERCKQLVVTMHQVLLGGQDGVKKEGEKAVCQFVAMKQILCEKILAIAVQEGERRIYLENKLLKVKGELKEETDIWGSMVSKVADAEKKISSTTKIVLGELFNMEEGCLSLKIKQNQVDCRISRLKNKIESIEEELRRLDESGYLKEKAESELRAAKLEVERVKEEIESGKIDIIKELKRCLGESMGAVDIYEVGSHQVSGVQDNRDQSQPAAPSALEGTGQGELQPAQKGTETWNGWKASPISTVAVLLGSVAFAYATYNNFEMVANQTDILLYEVNVSNVSFSEIDQAVGGYGREIMVGLSGLVGGLASWVVPPAAYVVTTWVLEKVAKHLTTVLTLAGGILFGWYCNASAIEILVGCLIVRVSIELVQQLRKRERELVACILRD